MTRRLLLLLALCAAPLHAAAGPVALAPNDDCDGAIELTEGSVEAGNNVLAVDDHRSAEGFGVGADVVYAFSLTETRRVIVDLDRTDYFADAYIRTDCDDRSSEVAFWGWMGGRSTGGAIPSTGRGHLVANLDPGRYWLVLDSEGGAGIPYRVGRFDLRFSTAAPLPGDTCETALPLAPGTTTGSTTALVDDESSPQFPTGGRDAIYRLEVTVAGPVRLDTLGSAFDTTLYVRSVCDDPHREIAASDDGEDVWQSSLSVWLEVGTYFVIVDGWDWGARGAYRLRRS